MLRWFPLLSMEILHRVQMGQDVYNYTEYARIKQTYIYIDNFPFSPQVWGSLMLAQLFSLVLQNVMNIFVLVASYEYLII